MAPTMAPTAVGTPISIAASFARASTRVAVEFTTVDSAKYSEPIVRVAVRKELVVFIH